MTDNSNGDDEDWYDDDQDELDDGESVECPECGTAISEFLDKCPKCGYWLLDADRRALRPGTLRPLWQRAVAVLLIAGFLFLLLRVGWTIF